MPKPKTDRTPLPPRKFDRTLSPKLFLKTLVSLVNSPILVVILPLNPIDPEGACLA